MISDFDAPVRAAPVLRSYIHWLVGNIPGAGVKNGETFFEYFPLRARADTGEYVNVVLLQSRAVSSTLDMSL